MQLQHDFTLPIPSDQAWVVLQDLGRTARCLPGATVDHVDRDGCSGRITLKAGPLRLTYRGLARILDTDEAARRLVVKASGRETQGSGVAEVTITVSLASADASTHVAVMTDLDLTGRPAVIEQASIATEAAAAIRQFARRLSLDVSTTAPPVQSLESLPAAETSHGSTTSAATAVHAENPYASSARPAVNLRAAVALIGAIGFLIGLIIGRRAVASRELAWPGSHVRDTEGV